MEDLIEDTRRRECEIQSRCNDARTIGMETLYSLNHQGEQLKNIKIGLTTVDATLTDTKQNINRLKGVTQRVVDSVRTKFHRKVFSKILLSSTKKQHSISTSSPQTVKLRSRLSPSAMRCSFILAKFISETDST